MSAARSNVVHEMLSRPLRLLAETRQLLDQLLADQAILMADGAVLTLPPPIPVQRSHGFTRPTTRRCAECAPPTVKPLYLQTYFRLCDEASDSETVRTPTWPRA